MSTHRSPSESSIADRQQAAVPVSPPDPEPLPDVASP